MDDKETRRSSRGGTRLEAIIILLIIGLMAFLAIPIYNSLQQVGPSTEATPNDANASTAPAEELKPANSVVPEANGSEG